MKETVKVIKDRTRSKVVGNLQFQLLSRFGFIVRGAVYFLFGLLGLEFSVGLRQSGAGFTEAVIFIQKQPFGQFLLVGTVLGFASYSLWSFLRAVLNISREKGRLKLLIMAGYLGSAVSYAGLAASTWLFFRGFSIKGDSQLQSELAGRILYLSYGRLLLILVGTIWAFAGIGQAFIAFKEKFMENLQVSKMSKAKEGVGTWLGKIGIVSRGLTFFLIGIYTIRAALLFDPSKALGTEKLMESIKGFTFGPLLLGIVCGGIMVFGVFSLFQGFNLKFHSE